MRDHARDSDHRAQHRKQVRLTTITTTAQLAILASPIFFMEILSEESRTQSADNLFLSKKSEASFLMVDGNHNGHPCNAIHCTCDEGRTTLIVPSVCPLINCVIKANEGRIGGLESAIGSISLVGASRPREATSAIEMRCALAGSLLR